MPLILNCTPLTPTVSDAVAERVTDEPETVAPSVKAVIETIGAVVSSTVTVKELCAELPCELVEVQVTEVAPSANVLPGDGEHQTASVPSTLSVAEGVPYVTDAPEADIASAVMLDGVPLMIGGCVGRRNSTASTTFSASAERQ